MALDLAPVCEASCNDRGNRTFLFVFLCVFAAYILVDSLIAALVIRAKLHER